MSQGPASIDLLLRRCLDEEVCLDLIPYRVEIIQYSYVDLPEEDWLKTDWRLIAFTALFIEHLPLDYFWHLREVLRGRDRLHRPNEILSYGPLIMRFARRRVLCLIDWLIDVRFWINGYVCAAAAAVPKIARKIIRKSAHWCTSILYSVSWTRENSPKCENLS